MTAKYYVTPTIYGSELIAQAHDQVSIQLINMVLGDANNVPYDPITQSGRTTLINQKASVPIQSIEIKGDIVQVTATIGAAIGGFNIHEIGYTDKSGKLVYIGNYNGNYKPVISEGSGGEITLILDIKADAGSKVLIAVDEYISSASKQWVSDYFVRLTTFNKHVEQNQLEHNNLLSLIQALGEYNSHNFDQVQKQLSELILDLSAGLYPKNIKSERIYVNSNDSKWVSINPKIPMSLLDTRLSIYISPEGPHEAWELQRQNDYFQVKVWHRSGTSRVGFNSYINYLIIQNEGITSETGNGEYFYTGTEIVFPLAAGESKSITIVGAGAGSGSSRYYNLEENAEPPILSGMNGEDSWMSVDGTTIQFISQGGKAGTGGVLNELELFYNGEAGKGGNCLINGEYDSILKFNGNKASGHTGGIGQIDHYGQGADGALGYLNPEQGYGGGGGGGAKIIIVYTNTTKIEQNIRLYVGKAGQGEQSQMTYDESGNLIENIQYISGKNGQHGYIKVTSIK